MKKIVLTLIITLMFGKVFADAGNCVKYKIGILLTDGDYIEGFIYVHNYHPRFRFHDISIKKFIIEECTNEEKDITIYLEVTELLYPKFPNLNRVCDFHLNGTSQDKIRIINSKNISEIKLIEFNTCHNCDKYDLTDGFYCNGIYPYVITELTVKEIDLLQTEPIATYDLFYPIDDYYSSFKVLSYNNAVDSVNLKKLCDDYLRRLKPDFEIDNWKEINSKYEVFKQNLRDKGVIIFKIGFLP